MNCAAVKSLETHFRKRSARGAREDGIVPMQVANALTDSMDDHGLGGYSVGGGISSTLVNPGITSRVEGHVECVTGYRIAVVINWGRIVGSGT